MGLYDQYVPVPDLRCPKCSRVITGWQGKDGPCLFLLWRQGEIESVDQRVAKATKLPESKRRAFRLPKAFAIFSGRCQCSSAFAAIGETDDKMRWVKTRLVTPDEARAFQDAK